MRRRDLRLLPLAGAAWGSALLCVFVPGAAWPSAGCCVIAAVVVTVVGHGRGRGAGVGLTVAALAVAGAVAMSVGFALPARDAAAASDGRIVEIVAEVSSSASVGQDGRLWFEAQSVTIGARDHPHAVGAPVRVGIDPADGFDLGARFRVMGQVARADAGERAALVVFGSEAEVVAPASGVFAVAADLRSAFIDRATRLPEPGAGLLPGLAVGDTRAVSEQLNLDMRTSGLSHLTAVSGANCALVVGAMFWLIALCGGGRGLRVLCAALALSGFVVLVTPEPSVIRAGVMAGVAMLTVLLGRPSAGAGMLALCATGILLADPWLATTAGFALSVAASGALILLAPVLARGLRRWMPQPIALAIAVPLAAQLVCGPIIALFADQQSIVGIAANILAAPAAPLGTVVGLLACLAAPIPFLADLLAASAWLPAAWIATTAHVTAEMPLAQVLAPAGLLSAVLVTVVSAAVAVVIAGATGAPVMVRWSASGVLIVVLALGGARMLLDGPLATSTTPDGWSIAACDVGQGDALVIRSAGEIALIDTGPDPEPLSACLRALGIDRIDLLVLTHFDLDHVGGVDAVIGLVDVVLHGPSTEAGDDRTLQRLAQAGARVEQASAGMRGALGEASWRVLWPLRETAAFPSGNDASVVVEFSGGDVPRSLFLGDLSAAPQRMLQRAARLHGEYTVVKVAHHGSADQDPALYERLRPTVALFSAGIDNDYGHPREETLDIARSLGAHVLRTDQQGRILLGIRGGEVLVWTERAAE